MKFSRSSRRRWIETYRAFDGLSEAILYFGIVFAPWAFGTTQKWSMWVLNGSGYLLGLTFLAKRLILVAGAAKPVRWRDVFPSTGGLAKVAAATTWVMATLTILLLLYCLTSAVNARASISLPSWTLDYRECITWLPHSYDQGSTWLAFWTYLALALGFWSARDWLGGLTLREELEYRAALETQSPGVPGNAASAAAALGFAPHSFHLPGRLRRLLLVMCVNGSLVALQGFVQRLSGSNRLLWLLEPRFNKAVMDQFGPFAYRGNACQYLNLLWPMAAALAWVYGQGRRHAQRHGLRWAGHAHLWLAGGAILMAAAPFVSSSRGGAIIAAALLVLMGVLLVVVNQRKRWETHAGLLLIALLVAQLSIVAGFDNLMTRFETIFTDNLSGRPEVYDNAQQMASEHALFGTGPWSFAALYQFYRTGEEQAWEAYVHNDWLEQRLTLGWIGFGMALALLIAVPIRWRTAAGPPLPWLLPTAIFIGLAGCLGHARVDFPFCVYSINWTFLTLCSVLCALGYRPAQIASISGQTGRIQE